ncbi:MULTISPECIES: hypothetical protein [unclassified Streptomyces]|uniref:hypothetical protein n=1 Tax=unclassified Streptomyces TaxID=2593676 RepID=UPI00364A5D08
MLAALDRRVRRLVWYDHAPHLPALLRASVPPSERVHALGLRCVIEATHGNLVRLGLILLTIAGTRLTAGDRALLREVGEHANFSDEACTALAASRPGDPQLAVFPLTRATKGWARVSAVEHLDGARHPHIKEWLIRDACTGDVLDSYFCLVAARTGDLAGVLARERLDEPTLKGATRLIHALTDVNGPGASLDAYEDAAPALRHYLRHLTATPVTPQDLLALTGIRDWFALGKPPEGELARAGAEIAAVIDRPESRRTVIEALADDDDAHAHQAPWAARALGLPYRETVLRRIGAAPLDSTAWYLLTEDCPTEEIADVVAAAEQLLPLDELLTDPETDIFIGAEYAADRILNLIVSRLGAHPGHGVGLLRTALATRCERNRRMAAYAVADWPRAAVPVELREALVRAAAREPVDDIREAMREILSGTGAGAA